MSSCDKELTDAFVAADTQKAKLLLPLTKHTRIGVKCDDQHIINGFNYEEGYYEGRCERCDLLAYIKEPRLREKFKVISEIRFEER